MGPHSVPQPANPPSNSTDAVRIRQLAAACLLGSALALLPWPYAYYIVLRAAFCAAALFAAFSGLKRRIFWMLAFIGVAVLCNPILPVHLGRGMKWLWAIINFATCTLLLAGAEAVRRKDRQFSDS